MDRPEQIAWRRLRDALTDDIEMWLGVEMDHNPDAALVLPVYTDDLSELMANAGISVLQAAASVAEHGQMTPSRG